MESEHGGAPSVKGTGRTSEPGVDGLRRPHENVSALPGCRSRDDLFRCSRAPRERRHLFLLATKTRQKPDDYE